jgi:LPS export ABC transporter protein LptC
MSPKRIAKLLALAGTVALAVILTVTVIVVRHRSAKQALTTVAGLVPGSLLHAHNFHWTQMKGDQSQWVLKAGDASYSADKTSLVLTNAELSMTDKDGKHLALVAPRAKLKLNGNHVSSANLSGGLTAHYGEFILTTEEATFSPDSDQIDAPGLVKIDGQGLSVSGTGLSGHPKAESFELLKQVTTRIMPRQKGANSKVS